MESESGVTRSIIDELHSSCIQGDQMEGKSYLTRSIIDELHSSYIYRNQMEDESGVTRIITDKYHSSDIQEIKWNVKVLLLEVSLMQFIFRLSKEIKWKV